MRKVLIAFLLIVSINSYTQDYVNFKNHSKTDTLVEALLIKGKKIDSIPKYVLNLKKLRYLKIIGTQISSINFKNAKLNSLTHLEISRNSNLTSVPFSIVELSSVTHLELGNNNIELFDKQLCQMKQLEFLNLWSNNIGFIPDCIEQLSKLKQLEMRVNEISQENQNQIEGLLPNCKLNFSPACNCN